MSFTDLDLHRAVADLQATARERDKLLDIQNERATAIRDWTDRRLSSAETHIATLHESVTKLSYRQERHATYIGDIKARLFRLEGTDRLIRIATVVIPPLLLALAIASKADLSTVASLIAPK